MYLLKMRLLTLFRSKAIIFWSLIFPIILATFYSLAFKNVNNSDLFTSIDIALIINENVDSNLIEVMENLKNDDVNIFNLHLVNQEKAYQLLHDDKVNAIINFEKENVSLIVNGSGIRQSIIKTFLEEYYHTKNAFLELLVIGSGDIEKISQELSTKVSYLDEIKESRSKANLVLNYYYSLIGMVLIYGGFFGTDNIISLQANMSGKGIRMAISPKKRFKTLLIYTIAGLLIELLLIFILLFYLIVILNIEFTNLLYLAIVCILGSIVGISFGSFITIALKNKSEGFKILITTLVGLIGSFLSGMMVSDMKFFIQTNFPILRYINPVGVISDALYSLNYFGVTKRFYLNITLLVIMAITFIVGTFFFYRRNRYESI